MAIDKKRQSTLCPGSRQCHLIYLAAHKHRFLVYLQWRNYIGGALRQTLPGAPP